MKKLISLILALFLLTSSFAYAEEASEEWYRERADKLVSTLVELSGNKEYITLFTGSEQLNDQIAQWHEAMSAEPVSVTRHLMRFDALLPLAMNAADVDLPESVLKYMGSRLGSSLTNMFNAQQGTTFLAASTVLNISEGFIMPEGFEPCMVVYEYDGICACVNFFKIGEGVVMATAQMCTKDVTMFLPRADASENAGISSPLLSETPSSEKTDVPSFGRGTSKRGK